MSNLHCSIASLAFIMFPDLNPSSYSFAGHSGPSRVAQEHALKEMILLGVVGHNVIFQKKPEVFK